MRFDAVEPVQRLPFCSHRPLLHAPQDPALPIGLGTVVAVEGHPGHQQHVHPVLGGQEQIGDQSEPLAEREVEQSAIRIVRVERAAPLGHRGQDFERLTATSASGGSARICSCASGSMSRVYAMIVVDRRLDYWRLQTNSTRNSSHDTLPGREAPARRTSTVVSTSRRAASGSSRVSSATRRHTCRVDRNWSRRRVRRAALNAASKAA